MRFPAFHIRWLCLVLALVSDADAWAAGREIPRKTNDKLLILGLGRVGLECGLLAGQLLSFDRVTGTVRSVASGEDDGIQRIPFQLSSVDEHLKEASHVLWTIPLPKERDENLEQVLKLLQSYDLTWIGMISTTGIYGNHDGEWVTEDSPLLCTPQSSNADLYRAVEQNFGDLGGQIFRCAGIYDSSRSALHTVYKTGKRPDALSDATKEQEESPTNRIHSYDIARAIVSSMKLSCESSSSSELRRQSRIFNLADDEPTGRSVVLNYAADLLESIGVKLLPPTTTPTTTSSGEGSSESTRNLTKERQRRRLSDRKLVSNERMKAELLFEKGLAYPSYREGLRAILEDPNTPWQLRKQKEESAKVS